MKFNNEESQRSLGSREAGTKSEKGTITCLPLDSFPSYLLHSH